MADNRISRELETREKVERPRSWAPPSLLPDPTPEPGYAYRWIRVSTMGQSDPRNVSAKLREGWEPVVAKDHPEVLNFLDNDNERYKDNIVIGGLMLCKTPNGLSDYRCPLRAEADKPIGRPSICGLYSHVSYPIWLQHQYFLW